MRNQFKFFSSSRLDLWTRKTGNNGGSISPLQQLHRNTDTVLNKFVVFVVLKLFKSLKQFQHYKEELKNLNW